MPQERRPSRRYREIAARLAGDRTSASRTILVTCGRRTEGKAAVAADLAAALALSGRRTLLLGADPPDRLRDELGMPDEGTREVETVQQDLGFLAVADAAACERALEEAGGRFDRVVIDGPPLLAAPESAALCRLAGAAVLVVAKGATLKSDARRAASVLGGSGAVLTGVVIAG